MRGIITSSQNKLQELINQNESDEKLVENQKIEEEEMEDEEQEYDE